ncbi:MAG TPA: RHS repeat-associated core domain-containing protein [Marmoricola sp.]|nr:RHS repeat-associated core domain-containing protein [Marmoricola sp.]
MFRYGPRPLGRGAESRGSSHVPGTRAFVLTDALGSIRAISDSAGTVVGTYKYSPYGTVAIHTGASISLQYAGGYTDAESGLTYYINRYYSPGNGTFTTVDPALDMTEQPYAYAANDPVNYTDPNGQWFQIAIGFIAGAAIDLGGQVIGNLINGCPAFNDISWGSVLKGGVEGAVFAFGGELLFTARVGAAVEGAAPMDSFLAASVSESSTATAIGDDANTLQNFARSRGAAGHDVIVHGDAEGNFRVNGNITHPQQIADAILGNPGYRGGPINLVTCHGACGAAQELSEIMGVHVNALTGPVDLHPVTGLIRSLG